MSLRTLSKRIHRYLNIPVIETTGNCKRHLSSACARYKEATESPPETGKKRVLFSGIQPTGIPHLGNYIGAIKSWVAAQNDEKNQLILSVVDLHSITMPQNPETLRANIRSMAACLIACGIDPKKTILFQQSKVSEHAELGWLLGCLTTMPRLQALPEWKEKSSTLKETPLGLFTYPVLQAADILLYKASHVPIGEDQVKHIQLAQHLAKGFNTKFGYLFPIPQPLIGEHKRIKSLRNPAKKMSKSDPDPKGRIDLLDSPDQIRSKMKKAVTDFTSAVTYDPDERPGVSNMIDIHCALLDLFPEDVIDDPAVLTLDTLHYKLHLAEVIIEHLRPIQCEVERLLKSGDGYLDDVLEHGRKSAKDIAGENYATARKHMGLL